MSFHGQRLRQLREAAGLLPLPSFHVPGMRLAGDCESDYIESAYFSPGALRWADEAHEYLAGGGMLPLEDMECLARVWRASRLGRKPSKAQLREFNRDVKWKQAEARIPELYAIEMRSRGIKRYGPDYELPDDVAGPGSGRELIYHYLYELLGYKTSDSASTAHNKWLTDRGMH